MPWTTDENGEKKYTVSRYDKDELPTWNEIYNEFYKNKVFSYNPDTDTEMDPYWKIPKNLFLIAVMCNQFNKMLNEDTDCENEKADVKEYLSQPERVMFCLSNDDMEYITPDIPIFHIPLPNGKKNELISDWTNRVDVKKFLNDKPTTISVVFGFDDKETSQPITSELIELLMPRFHQYFAEPIGWKLEGRGLEQILTPQTD